MKGKYLRLIRLLSGLLALVLLVAALWQWWTIRSDEVQRLAAARTQVGEAAVSAEASIEGVLQRVADSVDALASRLTQDPYPDEASLRESLERLLYLDPGFVAAGIAYAPFTYDHRTRLFAVAAQVGESGVGILDLDVDQDYTNPGVEWYRLTMQGQSVWLPPAYDEDSRQVRTLYAAPVYGSSESDPIGVVFARYNVTTFEQVMNAFDLGKNGYAFLLSGDGRYLIHPNLDLLGRQSPLRSGGSRTASPNTSLVEAVVDSATERASANSAGQSGTRTFLRPVDPPGWMLGITVAERDFLADPESRRRAWIWLLLILGLAILFAAVPTSTIVDTPQSRIWTLSWVVAILCVALYWLVIRISFATPELDADDQLVVTRPYKLNAFISSQMRRTLNQRSEIPLFIPTGIYVQSLNFTGPTDLRVTGYIWQRYTDGIHDHVERGFIMPESASFELEQSYSTRVGHDEVIGWNFRATLSEALEYSGYPFGSETVAIQLWHKQFYRNVILVPDLGAYKNTRPEARPGLVQELSVPGWNIRRSYFGYRYRSYVASFGLKDYEGLTDFPELYFNMALTKQIIGPLVSNILPLTVVLILLFALLVLGSSRGQQNRSGIAIDAVAAGGGLFLLVIFSHIGLRETLAAKQIFYLEYYYFLVYVVILSVTVSYLLFTKTNLKFVQYRENLIAKTLYWPLTQFAILVVTLAEFY
jgi:hypothetical protein